jgi:predicted Ser/Thr protein kinase
MVARIGKYERVRKLGQGSMGEVYLAIDPTLDRPVAIKTILRDGSLGEESERRFEREAKALAALNHPNIVTIYDFGTDGGSRYLAMEYLEGDDLAAVIERREPGRADQLEALAQVCEALAAAHGRGLVHRDVKPGNIMVLRRGGRVLAKLMDFGIATLDRSDLTARDSWMGTVSYMAPEYLDTGKATASGDLFAAGVILYEILSGGRRPFEGETSTAVLTAILGRDPAPLDPAVLRQVPRALVEVMTRALAKDPAGRYPDGEAMAAAIRAAAADVPPGPVVPAPVPVPAPAPAPTTGGAVARDLVVGRGSGADCLSLRVALRQAAPGATIRVRPGTYREHLRVDREVTLKGEGGSDEVALTEGITVAPEGALTLSGFQVGRGDGPALLLEPGARFRGEDVRFEGAPAGGAELGPGSDGRFLRCRFHGNGGPGLVLLEGCRAELQDCELIRNQDAGLHACGGAQATLRGCRLVLNLGLGAGAVDGAELLLERCELGRNQEPGLALAQGAAARLQRCVVTGGQSLGLLARAGTSLALEACQVSGNAGGGLCLPRDLRAAALGPDNRIQDAILELPA